MSAAIPVEKITEEEMARLKDELVAPFPLLDSPLYRCRMFETEKYAYLFCDVHHIVYDGTSLRILMNSVINAYLGAALETDYYYLVLDRREQMKLTDFYQECVQYHVDKYEGTKWTRFPKPDKKEQENTLGTIVTEETVTPLEISFVEKKYMVSRNEFYIAATLLALAISTHKNDVNISWIYNGRDDVCASCSVGLLFRELPIAMKLRDDIDLHDIFSEIHAQARDGIKYSAHPYMASKPQTEDGDVICVIYQGDLHEADVLPGIDVTPIDVAHNKAAAMSILDIQILEGEDGLEYVFDYAAARYEEKTMLAFSELLKYVVASLTENTNTERYTFKALKREVREKKRTARKEKHNASKKKQ